jgi:hypothetical protein
MSRRSPHHWPSPREVGLGSLVSPAPGFVAGPCLDASVFALCCGPQSGSPLDQVPPLSGRQRLLHPSFPRPGHPEARSDMTTQPTGLVLRWDSHPLGECCCELQLPSTGSRGSVPPLQRYYSTLRIPVARPAALRCLRLAVSRSHPSFAPAVAGCAGHGPGVGHPVPPAGYLPRRRRGLPGSWGTPRWTCPVLRPRRDRARQAIAAPRRGLPLRSRRRLPRISSFRGSIARPVHSLSTLRSPGRPGTTQDSLPAAGQALPGGGRCPAGSQREVSALQSLPPLPSFPGARTGEL